MVGSYLTLEVEELCFISNLCLGIFNKDAKDICGFQNAKFEENREDRNICRQHCTDWQAAVAVAVNKTQMLRL